jgi:hypothetical protein
MGSWRLYIMDLYVFKEVEMSYITERRGQVVSTPASYSGGPGFKFRLGDRLS